MSDENRKLRSEEVYALLREEITDGVIPPGAPLVEDEIAARLGVSRTPVRESIQRLAADGLVESRRRRWVVHLHTAEEVAAIYDVRAALESHAARLAATRATDEELAEIEQQRDRMTGKCLMLLPERAKANDAFHDMITRSSGNLRLLQTIHDHRLFHFNQRIAVLYSQAEMDLSSKQHGELIDALTTRDEERAHQVAREHVDFSLDVVLRKLY